MRSAPLQHIHSCVSKGAPIRQVHALLQNVRLGRNYLPMTNTPAYFSSVMYTKSFIRCCAEILKGCSANKYISDSRGSSTFAQTSRTRTPFDLFSNFSLSHSIIWDQEGLDSQTFGIRREDLTTTLMCPALAQW